MSHPSPPQLVPGRPFPPYTHVPGCTPHPVSDPSGHMHGQQGEEPPPLCMESWETNQEYLWGMDLFNHGYYWESHEAWEELWHGARSSEPEGTTAEFLKGLIKLAAAGVKFREGNANGVLRHAQKARGHFENVQHALAKDGRYLGLALGELLDFTFQVERMAEQASTGTSESQVLIAFPFFLRPSE